jgi:hypothetical protein
VVAAPNTEEEVEDPLAPPEEWASPKPGRRPDIFPEFEKLKTPPPRPMPGDPPLIEPEEDDEFSEEPVPEEDPPEEPDNPEELPDEEEPEPERTQPPE